MKTKMGRYLSKQITLVKSLDLVRGADIFFWYSLGFSIAVTCRWNSDYGNYGKTIRSIMFQRVSSCAEKIFFLYDCWMLFFVGCPYMPWCFMNLSYRKSGFSLLVKDNVSSPGVLVHNKSLCWQSGGRQQVQTKPEFTWSRSTCCYFCHNVPAKEFR